MKTPKVPSNYVLNKKKSGSFALLLFLLGAALIVFTYFLLFPITPLFDLNPDYFDYLSVSFKWLNGNFGNYSGVLIDLPLGYPLLLTIQYSLKASSLQYIYLILSLTLISYLILGSKLVKFWGIYGGVSALLLSLYLIEGKTMKNLTSLMPDAPYFIILLLMFSQIIEIIYGKRKKSTYLWLAFFALLVPAFRSNGILVFPFLACLIFVFWKFNYANWKFFMTGTISIALSFALLSYFATGYLNYGNTNRLIKLLSHNSEISEVSEVEENKGIKTGFYFYSASKDHSQFFFNQIPHRMFKHYEQKRTIAIADYKMYDWSSPVPISWRQPIQLELNEIISKSGLIELYKKDKLTFKNTNSFGLKVYHILYKLYSFAINSSLFLGIFYMMFFYNLYFIIKNKKQKEITLNIGLFFWYLGMATMLFLVWDFEYFRYAFPQDFLPVMFLPLLLKNLLSPHAPQ